MNIFLLLIFFPIVGILFYCILYTIIQNFYVAFTLTLLSIYLITRLICRLIAFPGSIQLVHKYYYQLKENEEAIDRTAHYLTVLEYLDKNSSQEQFQNVKNFFEVQYKIFQKMERQMNQQQRSYSYQLSNLIELFQSQQNLQLIKIEANKILKFLDDQSIQFNKLNLIQKLFRQQMLFGTLEQCRLEILLKNSNVSRHIIKYQNNSIDCIHILNNKSNGPTVLFCNPNARYYEHLYKNCTWIKIYQKLNINIILWNYCEYGYSTGTLTTNNIIECGTFVAQYFQNKFQIKTLGVHGLSLGGMFASEIAQKLKLSFLIADRTFSSLGQVAFTMCNSSIIRFLLNCIVNWDFPNYQSFYNFKGPKLIIQDANDETIFYISQLQTGVVRQYFTNQKYSPYHSYFNKESKQYMDFFFQQILSENLTNSLSESLQIFINFDEQQQNHKNNNQKHQQFYQEIYKLLSQIEYCHNNIFTVMNYNPTPEKIALFFGSCFIYNQNNFDVIKSIIIKIRKLLKQYNSQIIEQNLSNQLFNHIQLITENIYQIVKSFKSTKQIQELRKRKKSSVFGYLLAINCGHNDNLDMEEEKRFMDYFLSNLFVRSQI